MIQILLETINGIATETDEEQFNRLTESAEKAECDPETLYDIERDLRRTFEHGTEEASVDPAEFGASLIDELAMEFGLPMDGRAAVEAAGGTEAAVGLLVQSATTEAKAAATVVKFLYDTYRRNGFYTEAGIDPEANWAELDDPVSVVGEQIGSEEL
ncbi:hypothetical protein [Halorussus halophilus]|uniref:hypothetical protein n=1 Tax=Halorussus halophilus TaxID=2650975 RepID=UPI00130101DB|nr:hypothetical protein [Halorussus halophilus]